MRIGWLLLGLSLTVAPAAAQDVFGESHFVGDTAVDIFVRLSDGSAGPHGQVLVRAGGQSRDVHDGIPVYARAAGGERGVLMAMVGGGATVEVVYVPIEGGHPATPRRMRPARLATGDRTPIGAAIAVRPDGFAVFWQEMSLGNPNARYETYLARFDHDGRALGGTSRVNADWPIAAVAWLPGRSQYYFLLFYGSAEGTRLCGVHVTPEGLTNVEHPYWVSRPGIMDEAQLAVHGADRVVAVYRDDGELYEIDVTEGRWGANPSGRRSRGRIPASEAYGLQPTSAGVQIRRTRL